MSALSINCGNSAGATPPSVLMSDDGGFLQSGTGAVLRALQSKMRERVSAKDFGATGVGTETAAIQAALTAATVIVLGDMTAYTTGALTSGSNVISWPAGSYTANANLADPIALSNLSAAPALTFANDSRHAFSRSFGNLKANDIYNAIFANINSFDVSSSVLQVTAGSTIESVTAVAGYFRSDAASPSNPVALFGCGMVTANNGAGWGINTLLQDAAARVVGTATGKELIGAELDFNIMNPGTQVIGVSIGGNSLAQPTVANGYICNTLGNGNKWTTAFNSMDGVATYGLSIGMAAVSGASVNSQIALFQYTTAGSVKQSISIQVTGGGYLAFSGSVAPLGYAFGLSDILLDTGKHLVVNGQAVVSNRCTGWSLPTGTLSRAAFDQSTVTLATLAQTVAALITDLYSGHGLIGA